MLIKADDTNWAVVPVDWRIGESWAAPSYLDASVLHLGHDSIRMERGDGSKSREIEAADFTQDDGAIRVSPGDHIVFSVYMKTSASSINDYSATSGVRLGIDFYVNGVHRIIGVQDPKGVGWTPANGYPKDQVDNWVKWGSDWTQRTMDFIVPKQYNYDGYGGDGSWVTGVTMVTPNSMLPWIQVWSEDHENADTGTAWFADAKLYINPTTEPTPTPTSSPTPTPTSSLTPTQTTTPTATPMPTPVHTYFYNSPTPNSHNNNSEPTDYTPIPLGNNLEILAIAGVIFIACGLFITLLIRSKHRRTK